jgi:zinc transporter 1/2/3
MDNNNTILFTDDQTTGANDWDLTVSKIITGTCLFLISVICGIVPFKLAKIFKWNEPIDKHNKVSDRKSSLVVSMLLCLGGGVLLATTFLHLLPEISHTITVLEDDGLIPKSNFHLAEILMMIGFFLIYMIEELVHNYLHRHQHKKAKQAEAKELENNARKHIAEHRASIAEFGEAFMRGIQARNSTIVNQFVENDQQRTQSQNSVSDLIAPNQFNGVSVDGPEHARKSQSGHGHSHLPLPLPHSEEEDMLVSSLRGLLIVLALSIHELFEGFAVGLEKTPSGVYFMFAAVSAHKFVIAFTIGVELMVQRTKLWLAFTYVVVYSIVSAIGDLRTKT